MGKGKFDKKQAVRFALLPGPEKDGKPSVLYRPVESKKSRLSKRERKNIISELAGVEEVIINGRKVRDDEIPAYVLDQIRGRGDLVFNQIHGEEKEEEVEEGDLYDIQDGKADDDEYEEYPDYEDLEMEKVEEAHEQDSDEDWEDEDGDEDGEGSFEEEVEEEIVEPAEPYAHKEEDFPLLEQPEQVEIDGITYTLTKAQARLLETVIPENYEELDFGGLSFKKYNEDGLPIADRAKYEKYFLKEDEKVVVIDTYDHVPTKPLDSIDNDFKPSQINGNKNVKEIEDALDYDGEDQAYEEIEDDFFAKMIQAELEQNSKEKQEKQEKAQAKAKTVKESAKPQKKQKKQAKAELKVEEVPQPKESEEQLNAQLDKALFNFEHNIEEGKPEADSEESEEEQEHEHGNHSMNFTDLQKREEYMGRDGELDWRCLTKKEKREYMKTKVIREFYDELRERQIEDKLKGKINVKPEDMHLKDRVRHITYEEDHVMQRALEADLKVTVDIEAPLDSSSFSSDEDDIVSFHQKTSIIASNLSVIEQPRKKKAPKAKPEAVEGGLEARVKVVPEQRNKNETAEQRKERKQRLRAQKKQKKEQKKDFAEKFSKIKKETMRQENNTNPLNKVSYVKIY